MACRYVFKRVAGNTGADFSTRLVGVTISTLNAFDLILRQPDNTEIVKNRVIDDDAGGLVHFDFDAGDFVEGDTYAEYRITDASGDIKRLPENESMLIRVRAAV